MSDVNPIPEGYHTLTPHIVVNDTKAALEFYKKAFGGETLFTMPGPTANRSCTPKRRSVTAA